MTFFLESAGVFEKVLVVVHSFLSVAMVLFESFLLVTGFSELFCFEKLAF